MRTLTLLVLISFALAQKTPVPPPNPPQEPVSAEPYRLEVEVTRGQQPAQGITALLYRLGPAGRALPSGLTRTLRISGADGRMSWEGLAGTGLMLQLRDLGSGFSLSLPLEPEFTAQPLSIGPFSIRLKLGR